MSVNVWTASSDGDIESVKAFLASGGDANAKDENGYTPLQAAVSYNHMELVVFLLASGADVKLGEILVIYPPSIFDGRVKNYPIEDHNVPTLQMMMAFCDEAAAWLDANEKHVVALHCKAGKGRAGMMACMLLLRMGFSASATDAIDRYNRERVNDRRGLTVVSQKKWVNYYAALLAQTSVQGEPILEPTFVIQRLKLNNTLTAAKPPKLRLRIYALRSDGSPKTLMHQQIGSNEFELHEEIRGCVMLEFYRERVNGCMRAKHFKIWFNTFFLNPDNETGCVIFSRSEMDWAARDKKYRRLPAAFELEMAVTRSDRL
ncbi:hypothetical protein AM588_10007265 [Phytophthora nicotianae]|uniref:Phosphatidylinositol-3,4,5-trisphosphate 3-phosphatase n=1 Tax=Phytophthora nicotianae TaxID=4792 RepID=A0A0W8DE28_PHYNI|nr:hypothetical protein AM588_10007265 [Phytophthora nicotianae]